ncbi:MAG: hypothetical protein FJ387_17670 [Verrucomicrobia bacterium]|nr:hypothetical protein [Verrucomicrobiota bacterium]
MNKPSLLALTLAVNALALAQVPPGPGQYEPPAPHTLAPSTTPPASRPPAAVPAAPAPVAVPQAKAPAAPPKASAAARAPVKARAADAVALQGTIRAIDKVAMSLVIAGTGKDRLVHITSKTRFYSGGRPATFADAAEGTKILGEAKSGKGGRLEALVIRYGAKSGGEARPAKGK